MRIQVKISQVYWCSTFNRWWENFMDQDKLSTLKSLRNTEAKLEISTLSKHPLHFISDRRVKDEDERPLKRRWLAVPFTTTVWVLSGARGKNGSLMEQLFNYYLGTGDENTLRWKACHHPSHHNFSSTRAADEDVRMLWGRCVAVPLPKLFNNFLFRRKRR